MRRASSGAQRRMRRCTSCSRLGTGDRGDERDVYVERGAGGRDCGGGGECGGCGGGGVGEAREGRAPRASTEGLTSLGSLEPLAIELVEPQSVMGRVRDQATACRISVRQAEGAKDEWARDGGAALRLEIGSYIAVREVPGALLGLGHVLREAGGTICCARRKDAAQLCELGTWISPHDETALCLASPTSHAAPLYIRHDT